MAEVDVVEVVRCKDCGAARVLYGDAIYCSRFGLVITKDDFCSKGYKKESEMAEIRINLNESIKFKPTDHGKDIDFCSNGG